MYCSNCGKQIPNNSAFCEHCGAKQTTAQPFVQQQPDYQPAMQPPKGAGTGLKVAFFSLLGAAVLAFGVFAYFTWLKPADNAQTGINDSIEAVSEWGLDAFSLSNIGDASADTAAEQQDTESADTSTSSNEENAQKLAGAWELYEDGSYIGFHFFDDGTVQYIEDTYEEYYYYSLYGDSLMLTDEADGTITLLFAIRQKNSAEHLTLVYNGYQRDLVRVDSLSVQIPAAMPAQTPVPAQAANGQDPDVVFADGFEMDIEASVAETWWASTGTWVDNPDALPAAPGYPKVYEIAQGEIQYIFDTEAMTVQMLTQDADGAVTDYGPSNYVIDPYGFYLYAFDRIQNIEGTDYSIKSAFFVCDSVLYEVEMVDGTEASNYIAYNIYGP